MQMAKFGQLYLQGGRSNPSNDERLILQEWIDASFTQHVLTGEAFPEDEDLPHGYLWYNWIGLAYCALGDNRYESAVM